MIFAIVCNTYNRLKHHTYLSAAIKSLVVFLVLFAGLSITPWTNAIESSINEKSYLDLKTDDRNVLEGIIVEKLQFYSSQFPKIHFVVLDSGYNLTKNWKIVNLIIGSNSAPLDYAHPIAARELLMQATLSRIYDMLKEQAASATLFQAGTDAQVIQQNICIITLDPWLVAKNDRTATLNLLPQSILDSDSTPTKHILDHKSHLRFVLDHEIFHCLDSLFNGPIAMSMKKSWGEYMRFRNEHGADAFAAIMNIADHGRVTEYIRTLTKIRSLSLLGEDLQHYTSDAIRFVITLSPDKLKQMSIDQRVQLASQIRLNTVGNYNNYIKFAIAANDATSTLGISAPTDSFSEKQINISSLANHLVSQVYYNYKELIGTKYSANQKISR